MRQLNILPYPYMGEEDQEEQQYPFMGHPYPNTYYMYPYQHDHGGYPYSYASLGLIHFSLAVSPSFSQSSLSKTK